MPGNVNYDRLAADIVDATSGTFAEIGAGEIFATTIHTDHIRYRYGNEFNPDDLRRDITFINTQVDGITTAADIATAQIEDLRAKVAELEAKLQDIISNPERKYIEVDGKHLFWLLSDGGQ